MGCVWEEVGIWAELAKTYPDTLVGIANLLNI